MNYQGMVFSRLHLSVTRSLAVSAFVLLATAAQGQAVIATVPVGKRPQAVALNPVTNTIYVITGTTRVFGVTVIDGATNSTVIVTDPNLRFPQAVAVNPVTNKIYVANAIGNNTIINGVTNSTITVTDPNAASPRAVA